MNIANEILYIANSRYPNVERCEVLVIQVETPSTHGLTARQQGGDKRGGVIS